MLRFDPDSLSAWDWELIEREPGPSGPRPEHTPTLSKLAAWASWGLFVSQRG